MGFRICLRAAALKAQIAFNPLQSLQDGDQSRGKPTQKKKNNPKKPKPGAQGGCGDVPERVQSCGRSGPGILLLLHSERSPELTLHF